MTPPTEHHPLRPFLPPEARLLLLGSFPPQRKRWSMPFYYPNFNNDFWRIMGLVCFADRDRFVDGSRKTFRQQEIEQFLVERGIALYDTATVVRRLNDNASDKYLEIVEPTDIGALLDRLPHCTMLAATGQKACETLCERFALTPPPMGEAVSFRFEGRAMQLYRMPSSSRAYPMKLEQKAAMYAALFRSAFN
jgi:G:T/U-mismatch repair DNA glycosylase